MKGETARKTNAILAISYEVKSGIGQGETGKTEILTANLGSSFDSVIHTLWTRQFLRTLFFHYLFSL